MVECICQYCGQKFNASPHRISKGYGKYCSRKCASICVGNQLKQRAFKKCEVCGKSYEVVKNKYETSKYCSRKCKDTPHIPITELKDWSAIKRRVFAKYGTSCYKCGWCESYCDVHHLNGNHEDNRLENLRPACPNCHRVETAKQKNWGCNSARNECLICNEEAGSSNLSNSTTTWRNLVSAWGS